MSYPSRHVKTDIHGAPSGKLAGRTVVIKDNIAIAGVSMMNGSKLVEGYTPDYDATVVTRILDAGQNMGHRWTYYWEGTLYTPMLQWK